MLAKLREKAVFEKEMVKSERMAAVGRLTASIAHEINNPLGGMLNAISTLKRHGSPDPVTSKDHFAAGARPVADPRNRRGAAGRGQGQEPAPERVRSGGCAHPGGPGGPQAGHATGLDGRPERHRGAAFDPGAPGAHQPAAQRHHRRRAWRAGGVAGQCAAGIVSTWWSRTRANPCCREQLARLFEPFTSFSESGTAWVCGSATRSSPSWAVRSVPSRAPS